MLDSSDDTPIWIRILRLPQLLIRSLMRLGAIIVWPVELLFSFVAHSMFAAFEKIEGVEFAIAKLAWWVSWPVRGIGLGLSWLTGLIVRPIEFLLHGVARTLVPVSEAAEHAEFLSLSILRLITAPVRLIWRAAVALSESLPRPVQYACSAPLHAALWLKHITIAAFVYLAEALNLDVVVAFLIRWTLPIWYPFAALINFVRYWFLTRQNMQLAWGLPILFIVVPGMWIACSRAIFGDEPLAEQYRASVQHAREMRDYDRMQLFERKLTQLGVSTEAADFRTAVAFAKDDNIAEAYRRMQKLGPEDSPGYPAAHFWIVHNILMGRLDVPAKEVQNVVGNHLRQLDLLGVKGESVDLLRAFWFARDSKNAEAAKLLKPIAHRIPAAAIERMRLDLAMNDASEARKDAALVSEHMYRQKRAGTSLSTDDYRCWAVAEEILGNQPVVQNVIQNWLRAYPSDKEARATLAKIKISELGEEGVQVEDDPGDLAERIQDAFASEIVSARLKQQISMLYHARATNKVLQSVFETIRQSPELPSLLCDTLGTAAATEGDWDVARIYLERAVAHDSQNFVALNNLAFVMLKQNKDLDKAFTAANRALESQPENFHFRETRGQILVKLGRWNEAIADLEFALNGIPDSPNIHRSLAEAYRETGNPQLAAVHDQYAN